MQKPLNLMHLFVSSWILLREASPVPASWHDSPMSPLALVSLRSHSEVSDPRSVDFFVKSETRRCSLILWPVDIKFSQHNLLNRLFFLQCVLLVPSFSWRWLQPHGFISGSSSPLYWSVCLCSYVVNAMMVLSIWFHSIFWSLELWHLQQCPFCLGLLWLFRISWCFLMSSSLLPTSAKKCHWY